MYRKTYVEINKKNIENNIKHIISNYDYKYYIGVVKGNVYGHGYEIINTLIKSGVNYLTVATLNEAIEVRKINKSIPILCLNPIDLEFIDVVSKNNITLTISDFSYYEKLLKLKNNNLKFHLKINTGMNRLGISDIKEINYIYKSSLNNKNLFLEGIYSHISSSTKVDKTFYKQIDKFKLLTKDIDLKKIPMIHIYRSSPLCNAPKLDFCNSVRLGIIMYGISLNKKQLPNLKPAYKLISEIIEIKKVNKGEYVGYNNSYKVKKDSLIGIIPIGYCDGFYSSNNLNSVLINEKQYKIVGSINMNTITVIIDKSVKVNDLVILINDITDYKNYNKVTYHQAMTSINNNIKRIYIDK